MKQFFRKVLSLYFDFILKKIIDSERKHLSRHRLLFAVTNTHWIGKKCLENSREKFPKKAQMYQ